MSGAARLAAVVLLMAFAFAVGAGVGERRAPEAAPTPAAPEGPELWDTLPPELLPNVAEGIMERISELEDDLRYVQELQRAAE